MVQFKDLKVKLVKDEGAKADIEISPLPRGYGNTLSNSLRRILLSSLEGSAITSVKIQGIEHEYTALDGIKEDVVEIILNLKNLKFVSSTDEVFVASLDTKGAGEVTAADLKLPGGVTVVDQKAHIATLTSASAKLSLEVSIERGVGYRVAADENRNEVGRIPMDADFTPIKSVSMEVQSARKGQETDLDSVIISIETDGSIKPLDALMDSAKILQDFAGKVMASLGMPLTEVEERAEESTKIEAEVSEEANESDELGALKIEDLPISKRSKSGLLAGNFESLADLKGISASELLSLPGFGNKSLNEVVELLDQYGVELKS